MKDVGNGSPFLEFTRTIMYPVFWIKENVPVLLEGWGGWLFWAFLVKYVIKLDHPPVGGIKIKKGRIILGLAALAMLIVSFSYNGIYEKIIE
jgi:hypothetical protein